MKYEERLGQIVLHLMIMTLLFFVVGLISYFVYYDLSGYLVGYWTFIKTDLWIFYIADGEGYNAWVMVPMMASLILYLYYLFIRELKRV